MGIEGKNALMQLLGCIEIIRLVYKPQEKLSAILAEPFRMPLYTENLLILAALYRLDDAIGRLDRKSVV